MTTRYYTEWAIKKIIKGTMDPMVSLQSNAVIQDPAQALAASDAAAEDISVSPQSAGEEASSTESSPGRRMVHFTPAVQPKEQYAYRLPDPSRRKDIEYYRDAAHRGYLAHTVQKGQGPSLFFRKPSQYQVKKRATGGAKKRKETKDDNKLW